MIYAIHAVGTQYIKFGRAQSVGKRLKELETASPHDLHIVAVANWPDGAETAIHKHLQPHWEKGEWFRDSPDTQQVIAWMMSNALENLQAAITHRMEAWETRKLIAQQARVKRRREIKEASAARPLPTRTRASDLPSWELAANPIAKRRAEREAFWKSRVGRNAAHKIKTCPLDVVVSRLKPGISLANESLDSTPTPSSGEVSTSI